jgi:hypothetical protein
MYNDTTPKIFYKLLIEDKNHGDRYESTSVYTLEEIYSFNTEDMLKKAYLNRYPDKTLMPDDIIYDEFKNLTCKGFVRLEIMY